MTQPLQRFLGSGDALSRLQDHAERLRRLQAHLERFLPASLVNTCSIANLKGDTLVLIARSGAAAARIKQTLPSLLGQFATTGIPVARIQVKVGVINEPARERNVPARVLTGAGRESLEALRDTLPADAPLRASLERLLARSRPD